MSPTPTSPAALRSRPLPLKHAEAGAALFPTLSHSLILAGAFKILLLPAYKSTDFEVHRNWLAITHSLPLRDWYVDTTSEWTLDYPPFFAYAESALGHLAALVDPLIVQIDNLYYSSWATVVFQRLSVVATELVLAYALSRYVKSAADKKLAHVVALAAFLSPGLLIIDHIHFQYNGLLYGLLVLALVLAREPGGDPGRVAAASPARLLASAFVFAALLCFKHIYLYLAPPFAVFLLRSYCLVPGSAFRPSLPRCLALAAVLAFAFVPALLPFALLGQLPQLLARLFPFSRGLCHSYWAPNVWALYSFLDRLLIPVAPYLRLPVDASAVNSITRGLVGDSSFAVLPNVHPIATFVLTILAQLPALVKLFSRPNDWSAFITAVALSGYASFLFGWHVHEKAILLVVFPFLLAPAVRDRRYLAAFKPLAIAGHISLFPLLFGAQEVPIKIVYTILWLTLFIPAFDQVAPSKSRTFAFDRLFVLYAALALPVVLYSCILHPLLFDGPRGPGTLSALLASALPGRLGAAYEALGRMEFFPLMLMSVYSALGVLGSWIGLLVVFLSN